MTVSPIAAAAVCLAAYILAYRVYARFLADRVFAIDPSRPTPAVTQTDDVDYVPANRFVLFGHQYASITGLSPMLGPAIAVIWGWLPAMIWVVAGAIFVGAVQDFGALVVSIRARGMSLGQITGNLVGRRGKTLFHLVIFFLIALAMGVFVHVIAVLFTADFYPESVLPSGLLMGIAIAMGIRVHRHGASVRTLTAIGLLLAPALILLGLRYPIIGPSLAQWKWLLLAYSFAASVLPVWLLLQPRDYINSLLLYVGVGAMYIGFVLTNPSFVAPAVDLDPPGAPAIVPFVFVVIACGAASGFHALVSSGTSAKQLASEGDARFVGYGAMIGESLLGLMAILACTAGFVSREAWLERYVSWQAADSLGNNIAAFVQGATHFLGSLGFPAAFAGTFVSVLVVSFALTSLDSATRLLRYNVSEMGQTLGVAALGNRYVASGVAVAAIWAFAFIQVEGEYAGLILWQLFGTTNQLLAGLALLAVTLYLLRRGKPIGWTGAPMLFMLASTLTVMSVNLTGFWSAGQWLLFATGATIFTLALWLAVEAAIAVHKFRRQPVIEGLEVELRDR
ncbi:MAG: carbon starvation protein A [Acidobacteria bacterium]|nr:carbon starvation protein A [Acidobacteriota bacterium]MYJ05351.1 carbon starvation protein A [Acidobacteriota bacterium]